MSKQKDKINQSPPRHPVGYCLLSLFIGVIAVAMVFLFGGFPVIGLILGVIGLITGGFAMKLSYDHKDVDRKQFMLFAVAGIMASTIAIIYSIAALSGMDLMLFR